MHAESFATPIKAAAVLLNCKGFPPPPYLRARMPAHPNLIKLSPPGGASYITIRCVAVAVRVRIKRHDDTFTTTSFSRDKTHHPASRAARDDVVAVGRAGRGVGVARSHVAPRWGAPEPDGQVLRLVLRLDARGGLARRLLRPRRHVAPRGRPAERREVLRLVLRFDAGGGLARRLLGPSRQRGSASGRARLVRLRLRRPRHRVGVLGTEEEAHGGLAARLSKDARGRASHEAVLVVVHCC